VKYLIFGGTGSLGSTLTFRLLSAKHEVWVFSRDEAKHHKLKLQFPAVNSIIGDIRNYDSVFNAINRLNPDIVINAAAIKQVPAAEDFIWEACQTNIEGAFNVCKALENYTRKQIKALSISTDKVAKPVNSYGMTKALQERIHLRAQDHTMHIHNCVRYGNVLESTGSVIPLFKQKLMEGKNLEITHLDMTRFILSLNEAVDLIFTALDDQHGQKIFVPRVRSAKITDIAYILIDRHYGRSFLKFEDRCKQVVTKIRPGEKMHEILISEEELGRTQHLNDGYIIHDIKSTRSFDDLKEEYSSGSLLSLFTIKELESFLESAHVI
jgi:FlaA1/EpsC-like NDP-sugar epimerase